MNGALKVVITADNKAAIAALNNTDTALKKTASQAVQTGNAIAKSSNTAGNALTNLGRIAQDAPYGFIGIQNNLNPLLESFQRLKSETGSTGAALKSMAAGLIGPAGLGIALSVGSALLVAFGDKLFKMSQETEKATKFNESFINSLAKERVQLDSLYQVATNANIPLAARKQAVVDLRSEYGSYLKNFSDEEILAGKAASAYTTLADAITKASRARAAQDTIIELQKKAINAEIKLQEIATKAQEDAAKARGIAASGMQGGYSRAISAEQQRTNIFTAAGIEAKKYATELQTVNTEINKYLGIVQANQVAPFKLPPAAKTAVQTTAQEKIHPYRQVERMIGVTAMPEAIQTVDTEKKMVEYGRAYNDIIAQRLTIQDQLNASIELANSLTDISMSVFTSLGTAMLQGQDIGEALANTFKKLAIDIAAAAARALIFRAILGAITGGTSEGAAGAGGSFLGSIFGGRAIGGVTQGPKSGYPMMLHGTEAVLTPHQMTGLINQSMNAGALMGGTSQQQAGGASFVLRGQDLVLALDRAGVNLNLRRG